MDYIVKLLPERVKKIPTHMVRIFLAFVALFFLRALDTWHSLLPVGAFHMSVNFTMGSHPFIAHV